MLRLIGRMILLPVVLLLGVAAALFVVVTLGQERVVQALAARNSEELPVDAAMDLIGLALRFLSVTALLPALVVIIVGEVGRIRSALYYIIGGGIALAVVPFLTRIGTPASALELSAAVWQVLAVAGFVGGLVYWLLAGRNA